MQSDFAVHTHITGRVVSLVVSGELDLLSSSALDRAMDELVGLDAELIVVDLRAVEFMDSTGLHRLLQAQRRVHELGRRFALIQGPDQVQRLFDLTGLSDTLTIVASPDQLLEIEQASGAPSAPVPPAP
jgi:anti-sigma B factor antagonist